MIEVKRNQICLVPKNLLLCSTEENKVKKLIMIWWTTPLKLWPSHTNDFCWGVGVILRDSCGVTQVRFVIGSKILKVWPQICQCFCTTSLKRAVAVRKHLERKRKAVRPGCCRCAFCILWKENQCKRIEMIMNINCFHSNNTLY